MITHRSTQTPAKNCHCYCWTYALLFCLCILTDDLPLDRMYLPLGLLHCRWILYQLSHQGSPLCVVMKGFPGGTSGKEPASQCRRQKSHGFEPWVRRCPGEENGNPLQYSCLGIPTDRGAWRAIVHSIVKSQTQMRRVSVYARSN